MKTYYCLWLRFQATEINSKEIVLMPLNVPHASAYNLHQQQFAKMTIRSSRNIRDTM